MHLYEERGAAARRRARRACSASRSGIASATSCCSRAIASASSRSTTRRRRAAWSSAPSSSRCSAIPTCAARSRPRRSRTTCRSARTPGDQSILDGVRKLPPGHLLRYRGGELVDHALLGSAPRRRAPARRRARRGRRGALAHARGGRSRTWSPTCRSARSSPAASTRRASSAPWPSWARAPRPSPSASTRPTSTSSTTRALIAKQFGTDHHELVVRPDAWELTEKLRLVPRRAVRRRQRHPDLPGVASSPPSRSRSCSPATAATRCSPATTATRGRAAKRAASTGCPRPLRWALDARRAPRCPIARAARTSCATSRKPAHLRYVDGESLFQRADEAAPARPRAARAAARARRRCARRHAAIASRSSTARPAIWSSASCTSTP